MKKILAALFIVFFSASAVSADEITDLVAALKTVAAALGVLLISVQGLKYVTAESPDDRAEAKKGLIWIIMGLLIAAVAANIVCGLYCMAISQYYTAGALKCAVTSGICTVT
jgi:FtsH-binding integral membrane protein